MKRHLTLLLIAIMAVLGSYAATPAGAHLEFLGIALDGNINSFNQKLSAKGFKYDAARTENSSEGIRIYTGLYNDYFAELYVNFDPSTRLVYGLSMFIEADEDTAEQIAIDLALNMMEEYGEDYLVLDEEDDSENSISFDAYNKAKDFIGTVSVEVTDIVGDAYVMISMFDAINILKAKD